MSHLLTVQRAWNNSSHGFEFPFWHHTDSCCRAHLNTALWMISSSPSQHCISTNIGFQKCLQSQYVTGYRKHLLGCVKGTALQPFSLSHSIQSFITVGYIICCLLFCQIFVLNHVGLSACCICAIKCISFTLFLSELRTCISSFYVSKQSEQRKNHMLVTTAFCVSYKRFILIYSFVLV